MKISDSRTFDDSKGVINKTDPKCGLCVKCADGCLHNVCHKNFSDQRRNAKSYWGSKNLPMQSDLKRKYCKIKTQFQTKHDILYSQFRTLA